MINMSRHTVGISRNGKEVYAYLLQLPLSASISRNPHLLTLIKEAVSNMNLTSPTEVIEQDMRRNIGYDEMIVTRKEDAVKEDAVFYARQVREELYTKFVKNCRPESTSFLTLNLQKDDEENYEVKDVVIGKMIPPPPGHTEATE